MSEGNTSRESPRPDDRGRSVRPEQAGQEAVAAGQETSLFYIEAVNVAAALDRVVDLAEQISLQSMNAKALMARSDQAARAIAPVTDFMNELSLETRDIIVEIDDLARRIARTALDELRAKETWNRFAAARRDAGDAPYASSMDSAVQAAEQEVLDARRAVDSRLGGFIARLEDIERLMRGAQTFVAPLRIEAASLQRYRTEFETVADTLLQVARRIQSDVVACRQRIESSR